MKLSRCIRITAGLLTVLMVLGSGEAYRLTHLEAELVKTSTLGGYRLEYVSVNGPLIMAREMAYLRLVSTTDPDKVYRSPLFYAPTVDFQDDEDEREVSIRWIVFRKREKDFELAVPQWRECWQNLFISNTPYTIFENG